MAIVNPDVDEIVPYTVARNQEKKRQVRSCTPASISGCFLGMSLHIAVSEGLGQRATGLPSEISHQERQT